MNRLCFKGFLSAFLVLATFVFFMGSVQAQEFCVSTPLELQSALNAAAANGEDDTIRVVKDTTYNGNFVYNSTIDETYNLTIEGGWGVDCEGRDDPIVPSLTVLDGGGAGNVLYLNIDADWGDIYVSGITLQNGRAETAGGAGLYAKTKEGVVVLEESIVQDNISQNSAPSGGYGGGVYAEGSFVYLANNEIRNNSNLSAGLFGAGGGAYLVATGGAPAAPLVATDGIPISGIELSDNTITGNIAYANGGGVCAKAVVSIRAYRNTISSNLALFSPKGGGAFFSAGTLYEEPGEAILVNNVISDNKAEGPLDTIGGGLYVEAADVTLTHNTIANNEVVIGEEELVILEGPAPAGKGGGAYIYAWAPDTIEVFNNIFWSNAVDDEGVQKSDVYIDDSGGLVTVNVLNNNLSYSGYSGPAMGVDNQNNDDLGFNPDFVDEALQDYHLLHTSPCIFAALAAAPWEPNDDRDQFPRPMPAGTDPDIGAYEFQHIPCHADFEADPTEGLVSLSVAFTDLSTGDFGTRYWEFGDGGTSTEQDPSHTYATPGLYTVTLTVSGDGGTCVETKEEYIHVCEPVVADFSATPTEGYNNLAVEFTDLSTGDINTWEWDFGDGGTSTEQYPGYMYTTPGIYTVSLTVTGCGGESAETETKENYIDVWDCSVTPSFTTDPEPPEGPAPLTIQFTDTSTGDVYGWEWKFGDGATSTEQNPEHTYHNYPGTYTAELWVIGCNGRQGPHTTTINVGYPVPEADFSASPTTGTAPLTVNFTDLSTGDITSWSWNFGDGGTSTAKDPSYIYNTPGAYTVSLTVTGPGGTDTETKIDYITVTTSLPDVSVTLMPDDTVIPRGGTLGVGVTITNNTNETQIIYFATNVILPNGNIYPPSGYLFGPVPVTLNAFESKSGHLSHTIPGMAPTGTYTYHGYVGKPGVGIIDQDQFDFEVTGPSVAGPEDWETMADKPFTE